MLHDIISPFYIELFTLFGAATTLGEALGFITGAVCVWLVVKQNIWTFPIGILNAVFFGMLFIDAKLYADAALQGIYLILQVFGWYAWLRFGPDRSALKVTKGVKAFGLALVGVAVLTAALTPYLASVGDSAPFFDAHTTSLSLAAQALMSFKRLENWLLWMAADVIYIPLYIAKGLVLTGFVYVIFLAMCIAGYRQWKQAMHAAEATEAAPPAAAAAPHPAMVATTEAA